MSGPTISSTHPPSAMGTSGQFPAPKKISGGVPYVAGPLDRKK